MIGEIIRFNSVTDLHQSAATLFASAAADAINVRGTFTVALSGGTTPKGVYSLLAEDARWRERVRWEQVRFFWGDERHVGPEHPDSNFRMANESMLKLLPIDPSHVYRIKGEYPSARQAAQEYEQTLRTSLNLGAEDVPQLDLVLLGMGPDGHTASLFPGSEALHEERHLVVSSWVKKFNSDRITLTLPVLNHATQVLFLVQGVDKAEALKAVIEGPLSPDPLPAQLVRPRSGGLRWFVDMAAASLLSPAVISTTICAA